MKKFLPLILSSAIFLCSCGMGGFYYDKEHYLKYDIRSQDQEVEQVIRNRGMIPVESSWKIVRFDQKDDLLKGYFDFSHILKQNSIFNITLYFKDADGKTLFTVKNTDPVLIPAEQTKFRYEIKKIVPKKLARKTLGFSYRLEMEKQDPEFSVNLN